MQMFYELQTVDKHKPSSSICSEIALPENGRKAILSVVDTSQATRLILETPTKEEIYL